MNSKMLKIVGFNQNRVSNGLLPHFSEGYARNIINRYAIFLKCNFNSHCDDKLQIYCKIV